MQLQGVGVREKRYPETGLENSAGVRSSWPVSLDFILGTVGTMDSVRE